MFYKQGGYIFEDKTVEGDLIEYIGWKDADATIVAQQYLGWGQLRNTPAYGFRRAVYDFCFGYVSGFKLKDILYYLLTRSFSSTIWHYIYLGRYPGSRCSRTRDNRTGKYPPCKICDKKYTSERAE